jgi:hypothetical protein
VLHYHLPAETARPTTPAAGPTPGNPGGITVRPSCYQAIRDRRHLARDLRRATPAAGHVPEPYPLRAPRPTLRAEGGLPCSRRLGRSRVRHRRDLGRAARATPYAGSCVARRGTWLWRLVTALLGSCSGSCSSSSWVSHGRALRGSALEVTLDDLALVGCSTMAQPWYRVLVTAAPRSADGSAALLPGGGRPQESIGGSLGSGQPPKLWAGRAERFRCAYVDRWHP